MCILCLCTCVCARARVRVCVRVCVCVHAHILPRGDQVLFPLRPVSWDEDARKFYCLLPYTIAVYDHR